MYSKTLLVKPQFSFEKGTEGSIQLLCEEGLDSSLLMKPRPRALNWPTVLQKNPVSQENQAAFYSACAFLFIHSLFVRCHLHEQSNSVSILFHQCFQAKIHFGTQQRYGCSVTQLLLKEA